VARTKRDARPGSGWNASFEARRREQLVLGLRATPAQRLAWLESMIELAHRTGALPRRDRDPWGRRDPGGSSG